jgi:hypothetical protein
MTRKGGEQMVGSPPFCAINQERARACFQNVNALSAIDA